MPSRSTDSILRRCVTLAAMAEGQGPFIDRRQRLAEALGDAIAVFNPSDPKERYVLFVRPRDRQMEIWNGRRAGVEGAVAAYGADSAYPIEELDDRLRAWLID